MFVECEKSINKNVNDIYFPDDRYGRVHLGAEGLSHGKLPFHGDNLRQKDRILTELWKSVSAEGAIYRLR